MSILSRETGIYKTKTLGWADMVRGTWVRVREIRAGEKFEDILFSPGMEKSIGRIFTIDDTIEECIFGESFHYVRLLDETGNPNQFMWHPGMLEPIY